MRRPTPVPSEPLSGGDRFEIRRMTVEDLDEVMSIERRSFKHPWSTELFRRELSHDWSTVLVAEEPEREGQPRRLLGFVIFWTVHDEVHILNVATLPEERRKGVARALLAETVQRARVGNAVLATLEVRRSNTPALDLYRTFGFRPVGVRPNYYVDEGEDAIVMVLDF